MDSLVTNHCWRALGIDPSTTLHADVRWGEHYKGDGLDEFVWLLQISGAAPANHFVGGYAGATSDRQPAMYFPKGGGSLKGVGKPGEIVWSRVFIEGGRLHADLGRGSAVSLPAAETERRWRETTYQWPIVHAVFHGVTRDQFMARHRANHVNIAYAPTPAEMADKALATKAADDGGARPDRAHLRCDGAQLTALQREGGIVTTLRLVAWRGRKIPSECSCRS